MNRGLFQPSGGTKLQNGVLSVQNKTINGSTITIANLMAFVHQCGFIADAILLRSHSADAAIPARAQNAIGVSTL